MEKMISWMKSSWVEVLIVATVSLLAPLYAHWVYSSDGAGTMFHDYVCGPNDQFFAVVVYDYPTTLALLALFLHALIGVVGGCWLYDRVDKRFPIECYSSKASVFVNLVIASGIGMTVAMGPAFNIMLLKAQTFTIVSYTLQTSIATMAVMAVLLCVGYVVAQVVQLLRRHVLYC